MKKNSVLIIGSGGREHALGWKLKQSPKVGKIYFAPGNAGTSQIGENLPFTVLQTALLLEFALKNKIDLTIVGPDDALAQGMVEAFQKKGLTIFGPTKKAAQLEWSKAFAKEFMQDEGIPTARYEVFNDPELAKASVKQLFFERSDSEVEKFSTHLRHAQVRSNNKRVVIKASGLALGKGVIIAQDLKEAEKAIDEIMIKKVFGEAGREVVVEEFLEGREISIHAFCDGETVSLFPAARDHKRIFEGNKGPNTGGMGTIATLPDITDKDMDFIKQKIVLPLINGMKKRGTPFCGLLFPGLMMTDDGAKVLEFNARFGDPETQTYMRLLKTDLYDILLACAQGNLSSIKIEWEKKSACCIVLASKGYPGTYQKGDEIFGLKNLYPDIMVFHAGTKNENGKIVTSGGRVLGITATGKDLSEALSKAYSAIGEKGIHFQGMQYRKDIGK